MEYIAGADFGGAGEEDDRRLCLRRKPYFHLRCVMGTLIHESAVEGRDQAGNADVMADRRYFKS